MTIQWFPGHMAAAKRKIAETLAHVDVVVEIVDARAPQASRNPMLAELAAARQRPRLVVLNKADLAEARSTRAWLAHFARQGGFSAIAMTAKETGEVKRLILAAQQLAPHRHDPTKPLRLMLTGIPNVGKSTLINALLKRRAAKVANEPAVTRQVTRYDPSPRLVLFDTPGLLWPKIEAAETGLRLAALGSIGENAYFVEDVAEFLGRFMLRQHACRLAKRYGVSVENFDTPALLFAIAKRRGCWRNGEADLEKAARILLDDFRHGALGRVSLETPPAVVVGSEVRKGMARDL